MDRVIARCRIAWIVGLTVHVISLVGLLRGVRFTDPIHPILTGDYALYCARVLRGQAFFTASGQLWGYDPFTMAGFPSGPIHELGSRFLTLLGVPLALLFKSHLPLLILEIFLLAVFPFAVALFVRLIGKSGDASSQAFVLSAVIYGTFGLVSSQLMPHGFLPYQAGVALSLVALGLFYRWITVGSSRSMWFFAAAVVLIPHVHPASTVSLIIPLVCLYVAHARLQPFSFHVRFVFILSLAIGLSIPWIRLYAEFRDWSAVYGGDHGMSWAEVWRNVGFRQSSWEGAWKACVSFYMVAFGIVGWLSVRRMSAALAMSIACWGVFAFVAAWVMPVSVPWRYHLVIEVLFVALAAIGMDDRSHGRIPAWLPKAVLVIACFALVAKIQKDVRTGERRLTNQLPAQQQLVIDYLRVHAETPGRFLVECEISRDGNLPHYLDLAHEWTGAHVLGGSNAGNFMNRFTIFSGVYVLNGRQERRFRPNVFGEPLDSMSPERFERMLNRYNVHQILAHSKVANDALSRFERILSREKKLGIHQVWNVRKPGSWIIEGAGRVTAKPNGLQISEPSRGRLVLGFHWIKTLRASPNVSIRPTRFDDSPLPFIEVDNSAGFRTIEIFNSTSSL